MTPTANTERTTTKNKEKGVRTSHGFLVWMVTYGRLTELRTYTQPKILDQLG